MNNTQNSHELCRPCVLAQAQSKFASNLSHKFKVRQLHNTQLAKYSDTQGVIYDDYSSGSAYLNSGSGENIETNATKELGELIAEDPRWGSFFNYTIDVMVEKGDFQPVGNDELFQELSNLGLALHSYNSLFNANEQIKDLLSTSIYYNGNTFNTTLSGLLAASYLYGADKVLSAVLPGIGSVSNDDVLKALYVFKGNYIPFDPANRGTQEIEGRSMLSHAVHHASHALSHAVSTVSHAAADAAAAAKRAAEAAAAKAAAEAEAARRAAAEAARQAAEEAKRQAAAAAEAAKRAAEQVAEAARKAAEEAQKQVDQAVDSVKQGLSSLKISDLEKASIGSLLEAYNRATTPNKNLIVFLARSLNIDPALACTLVATAQRQAIGYATGGAMNALGSSSGSSPSFLVNATTAFNKFNNATNATSAGGALLTSTSGSSSDTDTFMKAVTVVSSLTGNAAFDKVAGGASGFLQDANACAQRFNKD